MVICAAVGVGVASAAVSIGAGVLRPKLPYPVADRLVELRQTGLYPEGKDARINDRHVSRGVVEELRRHGHLLEDVLPYSDNTPLVIGEDQFSTLGVAGPHHLLSRLGMRPQMGRLFHAAEDIPGEGHVIVLSHDFWVSRFGRDRDIVGKGIRVRPLGQFVVVGVLDSGSVFPPRINARFFVPLGNRAANSVRSGAFTNVLAILGSGVDPSIVEAVATAIARRLAPADRATIEAYYQDQYGTYAPPTHAVQVRVAAYRGPPLDDIEHMLLRLVVGLAAIVLAIGTLNVTCLVLAGTAARGAEMAVRAALGARWPRLVMGMVGQTVFLVGAGGTIGTIAAIQLLGLVRSRMSGPLVSYLPHLDVRVITIAASLALISAIAAAVWPAARLARLQPGEALRKERALEGSQPSASLRRLVVLEVAFTTALCMTAGLFLAALYRHAKVDRGFNPAGITILTLLGPETDEPARRVRAVVDAIGRVRQVPGVEAVVAGDAPVPGSFTLRARSVRSAIGNAAPGYQWVNPVLGGYIEALGITLLAGRDISDAEATRGAPVTVLSRNVAEALWPHDMALGKRVYVALDTAEVPLEVVGVANDLLLAFSGAAPLAAGQVYIPYPLQVARKTQLLVQWRAAQEPDYATLASVVRSGGAEPIQMEEMFAALRRGAPAQMILAVTLAILALLALALGMAGLYGVTEYVTSRRTRELGVRMALGASPRQLMTLVLGEAGKLIGSGTVLGLMLGMLLGKAIPSLLFGLDPTHPLLLGAVALLVATVGLTASLKPAWAASGTDPAVTLRGD